MIMTKDRYTADEVDGIRTSAGNGDAQAQYELGRMYSNGKGVEKDHAEAVKWFTLAAEQGHAGGQNSLGSSYLNGKGVAQDLAEAIRLFKLAAEQGYADAQSNLGRICAGGGISDNNEEARKWYGLAAAQGHKGAKMELESMPDENEAPNVVIEKFTVRECIECGRISSTSRGRGATTFRKENIYCGDAGRHGGFIGIVKRIRSSDCSHCHPDKAKREREATRESGKKQRGKIFADEKSVSVVHKKSCNMITLSADRDDICISSHTGGLPGSRTKELTEDEFEERIERFRSDYECVFDDIRRSAGEFDWRAVIRKESKEHRKIKTGPADEKTRELLREDVTINPVALYECAYCYGQYFTEENARKCAASCKEKKTADAKEHSFEFKDAVKDDVTIYRPWRCAYCHHEYGTEDEARRCSARCREDLDKDWEGRIFTAECSDIKDIWVVRDNPSSSGSWGKAIWIRIHPEHIHIMGTSFFDPMRMGNRLKELTEGEFTDQIEEIYAKGIGLLDDLSHSRGEFDWKDAIAKDV